MMTQTATHTIEVPGACVAFDVCEPEAPNEHRPLFVLGSPMAASGFGQLIGHIDDRTVITYDPRGTERSTLGLDGDVTVEGHADDLHRVVEATGMAPVDVFASSGGAVNALCWIVGHPGDVRTLVAHEPPLVSLLEDRETARKVSADILDTYQQRGYGPAMAKFVKLVMHPGPLPDNYLDQPAPDPAQFGLPARDDGSRDDLLLSRALAMPPFEPDAEALRASAVHIVPAIGAEGEGTMARRGGEALAELLGLEPAVFPGDHGGFATNEWSPDNDPGAFAQRLRELLDAAE
jgi:pimeloyl-ACP methyl ester carboxylesterase